MKWGNLQHKGEITVVMPFLKRECVFLLTHASPTNGGVKIVFLVGRTWINSFRSRYLLLLRTVTWELADSSLPAPQSCPEVWYREGEERFGCLPLSPGGSPGKWKAESDKDPCFLYPCAQDVFGSSLIVAAVEGLYLCSQARWQHSGIFHWNRFQLIKSAYSGKSDFYSPLYYSWKFQLSWNTFIFSERNNNWSLGLLICSKLIRLCMVVQFLVGILLVLLWLLLVLSTWVFWYVTQQPLFN